MEQYKEKIKRRIMLFSVGVLGAAILCIYDFFVMRNLEMESMRPTMVVGFQFGLILGIGMLSLIQVIKLSKIIKDDKKLKILHNKEHDERLILIRSKSGMPMLLITSVLMIIVAIVYGHFNTTVFITLVLAAMIQLLIGLIVKLYCMKTM